jgi:hypothetical protein
MAARQDRITARSESPHADRRCGHTPQRATRHARILGHSAVLSPRQARKVADHAQNRKGERRLIAVDLPPRPSPQLSTLRHRHRHSTRLIPPHRPDRLKPHPTAHHLPRSEPDKWAHLGSNQGLLACKESHHHYPDLAGCPSVQVIDSRAEQSRARLSPGEQNALPWALPPGSATAPGRPMLRPADYESAPPLSAPVRDSPELGR